MDKHIIEDCHNEITKLAEIFKEIKSVLQENSDILERNTSVESVEKIVKEASEYIDSKIIDRTKRSMESKIAKYILFRGVVLSTLVTLIVLTSIGLLSYKSGVADEKIVWLEEQTLILKQEVSDLRKEK